MHIWVIQYSVFLLHDFIHRLMKPAFSQTLTKMEALPPPSGGDQDRGPALMAMWWTELSISIIMVAMRMYSHYRLKNVGVDDWFMVTALVGKLAISHVSE